RSWMRLANALSRHNPGPGRAAEQARVAECMAAFDKAIALNPRLIDAYDQKAFLLAQMGRFEEAFAVCNTPLWNGAAPLPLRARAAWIDAQQGNLQRAIDEIREVLKIDPNYYWCWSQLADWLQASALWKEYREAAEHLVRLAPNTALPLAYRGEARVRLGDR